MPNLLEKKGVTMGMNSSKQTTGQAAAKEEPAYQSSSRLFEVPATTYGACSIPTIPPSREFSLREKAEATVRAGAKK